jgi:hypothetical protein
LDPTGFEGVTLNLKGVMVNGDANTLTPALLAALDKDNGILFLAGKAEISDLSELCVFTLPDKVGWSAYVVVGIPGLAVPDPIFINVSCAVGELADLFYGVRLTPQAAGGVKLSEVDPQSRLAKTLKKGDVVRALNGTPTNAAPELLRLAELPPGKATMILDRDGKVFTIQIHVLVKAIILKTGPKAEADAKKIFEEAEKLLAENPKGALDLYQQLLAEYLRTEFVSKQWKTIIEERLAQLKSKKQ